MHGDSVEDVPAGLVPKEAGMLPIVHRTSFVPGCLVIRGSPDSTLKHAVDRFLLVGQLILKTSLVTKISVIVIIQRTKTS